MKKICILFSLITKQYLKNPVVLALIALLPLSALILSHSGIEGDSMELNIGIYCENPDELTGKIFAALEKNEGIAHFVSYRDPEQMTLDILGGSLQFGYLFQAGLTEKLDKGRYSGAISLLTGGNSDIAVSLGNEIIFSVLLQCYNPNLIANFTGKNPMLAPYAAALSENIFETLSLYETNGSTYHVEFGILGNGNTMEETTQLTEDSMLFPLRGTLYILIFAAGLFGSLQFLHEKLTGLFQTMPGYCAFAARFLYPLSITLIVGFMAMLTLLFSGIASFTPALICEILVYVLFIVLYCGFLTFVIPSEMIFAGAIPIFLIVSFVACPVFINLKPFVPGIDILRSLIPPGYFL